MHHGEDGGVDRVRIDERFVALNVHHDVAIFSRRDLGYPVGAGEMVGAGHADAGAEVPCNFEHLIVIRGNDNCGEVPRLGGALVDVLDHRFGGDLGENFTGKTRGGQTGRDDAENFTRHTRSYHKTPVINSKKEKGWQAIMLPSYRALLLSSVIVFASLIWAAPQGPVTPRPKPVEKSEPAAKANIRVDSTLVLIPVTVTDPLNRFVTGLDKENFKVFEDKKEQEISQFSSEDAPLSIGVIFDCSGSMGRKLEKSRLAVAQFFKTANPEDEFFLVEFNDQPKLLVPLTRNTQEIQNQLTFSQSKGRTALLDAIFMAMHEMKRSTMKRKALLIISDGGDNSSRYTETEVRNLVRESDVLIYAIGIFEPYGSRGRSPEELSGPGLLNELAEQTGGRHFPVDDLAELPDVAAKIGIELRNRYVLGYSPTDYQRDGRYHRVKVQLITPHGLPQLKAYWRLGYFAPAE